ncbi:flavin reductase [Roseovarius indicus]|jgi:flavin reductase (DIM6/NTAB) family NADH-FMN oxidoreductase RutF/DNA-binding MarR family transcriptional regulator|uniref:FMN reductase (NADH) NtaB n=1 Tax=Roseovarius indicus TaxID=540747 RepID=A0A5P3A9G3_9RHOB|nr:flavin reductase [Roseovarius indicus]QEW25028.1 FMN reductase (NADH) NtaB [Roseovarius indicus]SFE39788.1 NADH-FMN oxidoreductase RutF, flavin reductase (DIM6/NTAB) family [Roseovarius indicus]
MTKPVEEGHPSDDLSGFRRSLGEFATGVTVITTCVDGVCYGMTSNSFASVSLEPPLVLWSVKYESQSFPAFRDCSHFAVNVLADDQVDLSQNFARSGPDKFDGLAYRDGAGKCPVLAGIAASFECSLSEIHPGGDHLILVGQVERYARYDRQPLLFAKGRYAIAADHPETRVATDAAPAATEVPEAPTLAQLLGRAYGTVAHRLEQSRKTAGLGLTLMQARLLKTVQTYPDSTLQDLLPEIFLDFNASQNILESLEALDLLAIDEAGRVRLTEAGEDRINAVVEHTRTNEQDLFKGVPKEDLAAMQRVLERVVGNRG